MNEKEILLETGTNEVEIAEFYLGEQGYGINVAKIKEFVIFESRLVTKLPDMPDALIGTFLIRGNSVPLIDLMKLFGYKSNQSEERQVVIITEFSGVVTGFLTDGINQIHRVAWTDFSPPGEFLSSYKPRITGTINIEGEDIPVLDLEHIIGEMFPEEASLQALQENDVKGFASREEAKIYMAEDSALIREHISNSMKKAGYVNTTTFNNGQLAYDAIKKLVKQVEQDNQKIGDHLNLLITDIEMPQMDGLALCNKVRNELGLSDVKIIVFSSLINEQMQAKCIEVGADVSVSKPKTPELIKLIDQLLSINQS